VRIAVTFVLFYILTAHVRAP